MRLVSLNVALFEANNEKLYEFLLQQKSDIVCLQEVTEKVDINVNPAYISKNIIDKASSDLKYSFFGPIWIIKDFHLKNFHQKENFDFDFGGFLKTGNYIKSRFRLLKKSNVFIKNRLAKFTAWPNWPVAQPRAVQVTEIQLPNAKKLRILNYHGIWTKEKIGNNETLAACKKINQLATSTNCPTIIAGDLNLFPNTESIKIFQDNFINLVNKYHIQTTRPKSNELSHLKRNVVDYIFISKGIKVNSFEVLDSNVSDHLPLILDFEVQ